MSIIAIERIVEYDRIVICGGPHTGKTTLSGQEALCSSHKVLHTDDLIGQFSWSGLSREVSTWFDVNGPWIVEGVAAVRALRKWMKSNPRPAKPCDLVLFLETFKSVQTDPQIRMGRQVDTIFKLIEKSLTGRGVDILRPDKESVSLMKL